MAAEKQTVPEAEGILDDAAENAQGTSRVSYRVLWYEVIGFAIIIALIWTNEMAELHRVLFDAEHLSAWQKSAIKTLIVLLVATPVLAMTNRLVTRLHHLEGFMVVCSWCRKLNFQGKWVPIEEFFRRGLETRTSHGMCPSCFEKMREEFMKSQRWPAG